MGLTFPFFFTAVLAAIVKPRDAVCNYNLSTDFIKSVCNLNFLLHMVSMLVWSPFFSLALCLHQLIFSIYSLLWYVVWISCHHSSLQQYLFFNSSPLMIQDLYTLLKHRNPSKDVYCSMYGYIFLKNMQILDVFFSGCMKIWLSNFCMAIINKLIGLGHLVWWGLYSISVPTNSACHVFWRC